MKKFLILFLLVISGCVAQREPIQLKSIFNAEQAKKQLEKGNMTLTGEAFLRQRRGTVVTCAGQGVSLIPETEYASERMMHIYGSPYQGYRPAIDATYSSITFIPEEPSYHTYTKNTVCDAQGHFKFTNLKKGKYIIIATVVWETADGNYTSTQGGLLMEQINLTEDSQHVLITR